MEGIILIIVLIVILLLYSFSKYQTWTKEYEEKLKRINDILRIEPNDIILHYTKAICLMQLKKYPAAIGEFKFVLYYPGHENYEPFIQSSQINIEFCKKPLLWSGSFPLDKSDNYWHHILLRYFGNTRHIMKKN